MDSGNYYEVQIQVADLVLRERLIAQLAEIGYDGFEETDKLLKAYIPEAVYVEAELNNLFTNNYLNYSISIINKQNWNQLWESNFEPVQIADFVGIRAAFHPGFTNVAHEIIITPKMSFGTGHHATTWLMIQLMQELDFTGTSVFDFGTGTGILAILAEKLGAKKITAVDNDDWCMENASENIAINHCQCIDLQKADKIKSDRKSNILLANINRNIILDNLSSMKTAVVPGGGLLLSGLLGEDEGDILSACHGFGFIHVKTTERNGWIALQFRNC